jgi:hypothetical protein
VHFVERLHAEPFVHESVLGALGEAGGLHSRIGHQEELPSLDQVGEPPGQFGEGAGAVEDGGGVVELLDHVRKYSNFPFCLVLDPVNTVTYFRCAAVRYFRFAGVTRGVWPDLFA